MCPPHRFIGEVHEIAVSRHGSVYLNQSLPEIAVPLASPDQDLKLALQPMIEAVYERSRYSRRIDYDKPLTPKFTAEESAWLAELLHGRDVPSKPPAPPKQRGRQR